MGWEVKGIGVVLHAIKMYPACGLMLKKKLLHLIIKLVVILNHLHPCYTFVTTTKTDQFVTINILFRNKRFSRHVTNFKTPAPAPFCVDLINMWSVTCLLWYDFFFLFQKNLPSRCLKEISQSSTYCLKTFLSHKIVDLSQIKCHQRCYNMEFHATNVYYIGIYWYTKNKLIKKPMLVLYLFKC